MSKKQKKGINLAFDIRGKFLKSVENQIKESCIARMEELGKASIEKTKGARVDVLEDISDVKLDGENDGAQIRVAQFYDKLSDVVRTVLVESTDYVPTLVVLVNRKYIENDFILFQGILGRLSAMSNLGVVYSAVKENWVNLVLNSEGVDCVLYMPEITCFQRPDNIFMNAEGEVGFKEDDQRKINILLYATTKHPRVTTDEPDKKKSKRSMWDEQLVTRLDEAEILIESILESAVRLNCNSLIIEAFGHPLLRKNPGIAMDIWRDKLANYRKTGIFKEVNFAIDN